MLSGIIWGRRFLTTTKELPAVPLSESQLEIWQNLPRTQTAVKAHEDIRRVVLGDRVWLGKPEIYLQGSYVNDTSTTKDRDVDVV